MISLRTGLLMISMMAGVPGVAQAEKYHASYVQRPDFRHETIYMPNYCLEHCLTGCRCGDGPSSPIGELR